MSDDIHDEKTEIARQIGVSFDDLSESLRARYGPGTLSGDIPDANASADKKIVINAEIDQLLVAAASVGVLTLGVRKFVKTYKQINKVRHSYAHFYG